jgi:hypothetical protein
VVVGLTLEERQVLQDPVGAVLEVSLWQQQLQEQLTPVAAVVVVALQAVIEEQVETVVLVS